MKKYILVFFILLSAKCFSQINVVPMPLEVTMGEGFFKMNPKNTSIYYTENSSKPICIQLNNIFKKHYGFTLPIPKVDLDKFSSTNKKNITFILFPKLVKGDSISGTYNLKVNSKSITVFSMENGGFFMA
jgi:hypothetical protein